MRKYIGFTVFVILAFCLVNTLQAQMDSVGITLENIFLNGKYNQKRMGDVIPLNEGESYAMTERDNSLIKYSYLSPDKKVEMFSAKDFKDKVGNDSISIDFVKLSPDENKLLIATGIERIYRRSANYNFYVWDMKSKELIQVSGKGKQRLAKFSPDGNKVLFVRSNNVFVKDLSTLEELAVTTDGEFNRIINGVPDWVYEEEFSFGEAVEWSSNSSEIAYLKFDESRVKEFSLTTYGSTYPETYKYKYPKSGEDNSIVSVWIYNIPSKKNIKVDSGENTDLYIPRIKWTKSPDLLSFIRLNRLQNKFEILTADAKTGKSNVILTEESKTYISEIYDIEFLKDNRFIRLSESDGYMHLYLHDINGKFLKQITKGAWEVKNLYGVDEENNIVYYSSNEPSPMRKAVYKIKLDGTDKKCLSPETGTNSANFSKNFRYCFINYSDANTPLIYTLYTNDGNAVRVIEDNSKLKEKLSYDGFVKKDFFTFKTSEGYDLNGWMLKPADMDAGKKYPLLVYVYGGNGSQTVLDSWGGMEYLWGQYLCSQGYIVASVDGRATGGRGEAFEKCNYMNIGTVEVTDQIEAAKYYGNITYVDKDRIGIWGWSYGGYMTSMCMTLGANYFKTGVAVAPVTDWHYYDNIYTERFMRTPNENPEGYKNSSVITYADKLKGKYLLIHGSSDDNVHMQNSMDLITAFLKANKQFDMFIYPNKNHNISGGNTRLNIFTKISDFVLKNL